MKNKLKIIAVLMMIINIFCITKNLGAFDIDRADLYYKEDCGYLLKLDDSERIVEYVVYNKNGVEYPAYCINRELSGIGNIPGFSVGGYTVSVEQQLQDSLIWRAIINGYPYKTLPELGVANHLEAFTATKQAVYCVIYGLDSNNFERWSPVGEAGVRTLNAMKQIVYAARNSNESKVSSAIIITAESTKWNIDETDKNYLYQEFSVSSYSRVHTYKLSLKGNIPEETKIVEDKANKKFKVIVPIKSLTKDSTFSIEVKGEVETKPVFVGVSPNPEWQNYALTGEFLENGNGIKEVNYFQNNTKIKILKIDKDTKESIEGVEFNILDENKNVIYQNLKTNKMGEILVENIVPGKYYVQEIVAKEGYIGIAEPLEIEVQYNETLEVEISNKKIEVQIEMPKETVRRLPVTGN